MAWSQTIHCGWSIWTATASHAREGVSEYAQVGVSGAQDPAGFNREVLPEIGALQRLDGVEAVARVVVCCIAIVLSDLKRDPQRVSGVGGSGHDRWCGELAHCAPERHQMGGATGWCVCTRFG